MNKLQRQIRKTGFYSSNLLKLPIPRSLYRRQLEQRLREVDLERDPELRERVEYCCKLDSPFELPESAIPIREIPLGTKNTYYLDFHSVSRYFDHDSRVAYRFGDVYETLPAPTLVKSRPVGDANANNVLLKWDSVRHFYFVRHDLPYREKRNALIWRGRAVYSEQRRTALKRWFGHPLADLGDSDPRCHDLPWYVPFTSIPRQLDYKFILSIEGMDVATNLKWILSSNSLCFMPTPRCETWFMEGRLIPGHHFVHVRDDFEDLEEKIEYYLDRPDEAEAILANAHAWVDRFRDPRREEALQLHVLHRYLELSGQLDGSS